MAITLDNNTNTATPDYTVPSYDASAFKTASLPTNPYAVGTPQANTYNTFTSSLDRAPTADDINYFMGLGQTQQQLDAGISGSPEAQTYGRARNEINPGIDSQIAGYGREAQSQQLNAQNQISSLLPTYQQQRNDIQFGYNQNQTGLDYQRQQALNDADYNSSLIQGKINPAILAAREAAARSGLLNSTVAVDRVNNALIPLQLSLGDIGRKSQATLSNIEQQRQNYTSKYGNDLTGVGTQESTAVRNIQNQLSLAYQQLQNQAIQAEATRNSQIYARAGSLGDLNREFGLQQQQVGGYLQNLQAQQALQNQHDQLQNQQFYYGTKKA